MVEQKHKKSLLERFQDNVKILVAIIVLGILPAAKGVVEFVREYYEPEAVRNLKSQIYQYNNEFIGKGGVETLPIWHNNFYSITCTNYDNGVVLIQYKLLETRQGEENKVYKFWISENMIKHIEKTQAKDLIMCGYATSGASCMGCAYAQSNTHYQSMAYREERVAQLDNNWIRIRRTYQNGCSVLYDLNLRNGNIANWQWGPGCQ